MNNPIIKFIIRGVVVMIISIAVSFVLVDRIKDKTKNIVFQKTNIVLNRRLQENSVKLRSDFKQVKPFLGIMKKSFPEGDQIISLISFLEEAAKQTGNQQAFSFESAVPTKADGGLNVVSFNVTLLGNMNTFYEYLDRVEKLPIFIKIKDISMSGKDGLLNTSRMSIKGTLFVK